MSPLFCSGAIGGLPRTARTLISRASIRCVQKTRFRQLWIWTFSVSDPETSRCHRCRVSPGMSLTLHPPPPPPAHPEEEGVPIPGSRRLGFVSGVGLQRRDPGLIRCDTLRGRGSAWVTGGGCLGVSPAEVLLEQISLCGVTRGYADATPFGVGGCPRSVKGSKMEEMRWCP